MTESDKEKGVRLMRLLLSYSEKQKAELRADPRLAYYTTAETANKLIRNQELWFRDCSLMNDSREVLHGIDVISKYFSDAKKRTAFCEIMDAIHSGAAEDALKLFDDWKANHSAKTYLMSFSRHAPKGREKEDDHGRLSMWRGYGGPQGVALVFNIPIGVVVEGFNLFFSPVGYFDEIDTHIETIIHNLKQETEFLLGIPRNWLVNGLCSMLVMAAVSLKHPGFDEEIEWRLLYLPTTYGSKLVSEHKVMIGAAEETIYKTTFQRLAMGGMPGMALNKLVDRVIVGPTRFPEEIKRFMIDALRDMGVTDAEARVFDSGVPFRFKECSMPSCPNNK